MCSSRLPCGRQELGDRSGVARDWWQNSLQIPQANFFTESSRTTMYRLKSSGFVISDPKMKYLKKTIGNNLIPGSSMIQRLVSLDSTVSCHNFATNVTRIGKISLKVFRLQMISNVLSGFVTELITNSTRKLFQRVLSNHNVLVKVFGICYVTS